MASSPLEEDVLAVGPRAGLVGLDRDERRRVAVVDLEVACPGRRPRSRLSRLAVITSRTSISRWATTRLVWPSAKLQVGPAAVDRVAVDRAVAVEPVEVLVEDGLAQLLQRLRRRASARGSPGNRASSMISASWLVALRRQMDAVDRERLGGLGVQVARRAETGRRRGRCWPRRPRPSPRCRARAARCSPRRRAGCGRAGPRGRSARRGRAAGPSCRCTSGPACA